MIPPRISSSGATGGAADREPTDAAPSARARSDVPATKPPVVGHQLTGLTVRQVASDRQTSNAVARMRLPLLPAVDAARRQIDIYPELNYLASSSVTATNEALNKSVPSASYSAQLGKAQHFIEFERSLASLRCMSLFIDGSRAAYAELTSKQAAPRLSYESFTKLSSRWGTLASSFSKKGIPPEALQSAAETALVLGDMGKAASVRDVMADLSIHDPDHDDFYGHVMANDAALQRLESFRRLSPEQQNLLRQSANLAHFGHITHCEGGPDMFAKLKASDVVKQDPDVFEFAAIVHVCDVAGALGHRNPEGSLTYDQATHNAIDATFDACRTLQHGDEVCAYESYLRTRAAWLGFSPHAAEDRVLARLGAMMRLATPDAGRALKDGFSTLSARDSDDALRRLSVSGAAQLPRTPTYMPAVLVNLMNNRSLGETLDERLMRSVAIGVPFISAALHSYQDMLSDGKLPKNVPLNFNGAAGVAATAPEALHSRNVMIDPKPCEVRV